MILKNWGTIYLGLKKKWILALDLLELCNEGTFNCDDNRLSELYIAYDNSFDELLELIKKYIVLDNEPIIVWDEKVDDFDFSLLTAYIGNFGNLNFFQK